MRKRIVLYRKPVWSQPNVLASLDRVARSLDSVLKGMTGRTSSLVDREVLEVGEFRAND